MITRNHTGHRCGACHQKAKLTDAQVAAMRADYDAGLGGYVELSRRYICGITTVRDIVQYRTRWSA